MRKFQGENISFNVVLKNGNIDVDISSFDDVKLYAYTDKCVISKFSKQATDSFYPLTVVDNNTLSGVIPSADTKRMKGSLLLDIFLDSRIRTVHTGISIVKNLIKQEA